MHFDGHVFDIGLGSILYLQGGVELFVGRPCVLVLLQSVHTGACCTVFRCQMRRHKGYLILALGREFGMVAAPALVGGERLVASDCYRHNSAAIQ